MPSDRRVVMQDQAAEDFKTFAKRYGGVFDMHAFDHPSSPQRWTVEILIGPEALTRSYVGDRNGRGEAYAAESGLFENMDVNGAASRRSSGYLFGMTLGVPLRLANATLLSAHDEASEPRAKAIDYLLSAPPSAEDPEGFEAVIMEAADPQALAWSRSMTFFSVGFVWMHEAFHTLIGHVDFARDILGLDMDELSLTANNPFYHEVHQAMELDADGAALTNFSLTVVGRTRFGICADGNLDPPYRVAQAAEGAFIALAAIEGRRSALAHASETSHPWPSRRIASARGLLSTFERRGQLPKGTMVELARRIERLLPHIQNPQILSLLSVLTTHGKIAEGDAGRLSELIQLGRSELKVFEETPFAPRVRLNGSSN